MQKGINLMIHELKEKISSVIGDSNLPITVTRQVLGELYIELKQLVVTTANSIYIFLPDSISSDKKLKKNIKNTKIEALDVIKQMNFKQFDWKKTGQHEELGIIADEVEQIQSDLVSNIEIDGEQTKVFNQSKMILVNSKAIQELYTELQRIKEMLKEVV